MPERWNTERVRVELGLASIRSAGRALHRMGINPVGREAGRSGMNLYDADEVRRKASSRPGRGRRTRLEGEAVTFSDLEIGDTFSFPNLVGEGGREAWEKTGPHACRRVNSNETQNVSGDERVAVLITYADRQAAINQHVMRRTISSVINTGPVGTELADQLGHKEG